VACTFAYAALTEAQGPPRVVVEFFEGVTARVGVGEVSGLHNESCEAIRTSVRKKTRAIGYVQRKEMRVRSGGDTCSIMAQQESDKSTWREKGAVL